MHCQLTSDPFFFLGVETDNSTQTTSGYLLEKKSYTFFVAVYLYPGYISPSKEIKQSFTARQMISFICFSFPGMRQDISILPHENL